MKTILIADDQKKTFDFVKASLLQEELRFVAAIDEREAAFKYRNQSFDLVIISHELLTKNKSQLLGQIREEDKKHKVPTPILVLAEQMNDLSPSLSLHEEVHFISLPTNQKDLVEKVKAILKDQGDQGEASGENSSGGQKTQKSMESQKLLLAPNEIIIRQGEIEKTMYWIKAGVLTIYKVDEGKEVILGEVKEGEIIGEMSFIDEKPRSASVRAKTEAELYRIPYENFAKIMNGQPSWLKVLIKTLSHRLREADARIKL